MPAPLLVGWEPAAEGPRRAASPAVRSDAGQRAPRLSALCPAPPLLSLLQVVYGVKEYARTAVDMISRRTRLAFLNVQAAEEALPRIVDIMGKELNWSEQKKKVQRAFFSCSCFVLLK